MDVKEMKDSINLPKTKFPMRGDLVRREPLRMEHWEKMGLYDRIQKKNSSGKKFVLHDGPPFTNGDVHIGTALNKILKDFILRHKSMLGYSTPYIPGWDCHGLPIEHKVSKQLREENRSLSVSELREECAKFSSEYIEKQRRQFVRLGIMADWKDEYKTKNPGYEAEILRTFAAFVEAGMVYRSKKPVYWSIPCATALAEAEIEYKDHTTPTIWAAFKLDSESLGKLGLDKGEFVAWTTTPWTLPANLALAVHPDVDYCAVEAGGRRFIVAFPLAEQFVSDCGLEGAKISPLARGSELEGLKARHPFIDRESPVICARYVTTDSGTGIVHIAPGHGLEDYQAGLEYGLEVYCPLDDAGRYVDDGRVPRGLVGVSVLDRGGGKNEANDKVLEMMGDSLLKVKELVHQYPHCWRSKTPVIFRAMDQWFVALDKDGFRDRALKAIDEVEWLPSNGANRIRGAVETRPDWCISRQRAWGVPIPAFYSESGEAFLDASVIRGIADKVAKKGTNIWFDESAEKILEGIEIPSSWGEASKLRKGSDTLDVWIDSGSSHAAVLSPRGYFPADLYLEGSDQHRGWFQSSLMTSVVLNGRAPYKKVITHGFIVDEQRRKISKSASGKPQTSDMYVGKWGADIVRMWISSVDYQSDVPVSEDILSHVANTYRSVRNTLMYQLGNLCDFKESDAVPLDKLDAIDKWALHKTALFVEEARAAYSAFEFHKVYKLIDFFCGVTLSRVYHDILKDRLYTFSADSFERRSSQTVINIANDALMLVAAPILTFTCDEAYSFKKSGGEYCDDSIHLQSFPNPSPDWKDDSVYGKVERILSIRERVNEKLESLRKDKVIGKSLEAKVDISVPEGSEDEKILREFESKLPEIFIVSSVSLKSGSEFSVEAGKAEGRRCSRCWRVLPEVEEGGICKRCASAMESFGKRS